MHSATLTFDQAQRSADRTLAVVLFAKHVKHIAEGVVLFAVLSRVLRTMVRSFSTTEKELNSVSDDKVLELTATLREIHSNLEGLLDHEAMREVRHKMLFKRSVDSIEESTEDVCDIIEDLALSCNKDFRDMISDCVTSVTSARALAEPVGIPCPIPAAY